MDFFIEYIAFVIMMNSFEVARRSSFLYVIPIFIK